MKFALRTHQFLTVTVRSQQWLTAAAVSKPADNVPSYGCTYKGEDAGSVKNDWRSADGKRYYFDAEGNAVRGWQYIGGYKYYFDETTCELLQNLDGKLSAASFHLVVDRMRCKITAYAPDGENGYIIPYRTFICSPGNPHTRTPAGSFVTTNQYRWHTLMGPTYGQYCTRIGNTGVLFHSIPGSNMTSYNISAKKYNKLGEPASHGCIRMTVADAKWIFDHCPSGTGVTIGDNLPAPFDRRVTDEEYDAVLSWMYLNELEGFTQEAEAADTGFIPDFLPGEQ